MRKFYDNDEQNGEEKIKGERPMGLKDALLLPDIRRNKDICVTLDKQYNTGFTVQETFHTRNLAIFVSIFVLLLLAQSVFT